MSRTLRLLRHAKSSWDDPSLSDHDRPLSARGERALPLLAAHLAETAGDVEVVLCSSSRRTRDTLSGIRTGLDERHQVLIESALYGAEAESLLRRVRALPSEVPSVLMIGHNPGLEDLVALLTGDGDAQALDQLQRKFPTGALATLDLDVDWAKLTPGRAVLRSLVTPRQLES